jgi:hypothetical protein
MLNQFVRPVKIGNLELTLPSLITAVAGIALGIVLAYKVNPMLGITVPLAFFVGAYNVNCTVVGQCNVWAVTLGSLYFIYTALLIIALLFSKNVDKKLLK